jgi:hypothetical protein
LIFNVLAIGDLVICVLCGASHYREKNPTPQRGNGNEQGSNQRFSRAGQGSPERTVGKAFGDKKLETEGKTDKAAGKVQNAVGGLKDALRGK